MEVPSHRHSRVVSSVLCAERGLKKKPISSSQHASIVKCLSGTFESKGRQLATYQITHALVAKWIYLFRHPIQSSHQLNQCTDHFTCWTPEYPINWEKIISFERKQVGRGLRFNDKTLLKSPHLIGSDLCCGVTFECASLFLVSSAIDIHWNILTVRIRITEGNCKERKDMLLKLTQTPVQM